MQKRVRVAINGLGRIGRAFLKLAATEEAIELVAVNDLGHLENLVYLLKYDSVYGRRDNFKVEAQAGALVVNGQPLKFIQEREPANLPWAELRVDVVVESTGFFEDYAAARKHLEAGAHKVVITAPAKGEPGPGVNGATVLMGINEDKLATCQISSNASCTTNAASPVIQIMGESVGVAKALLNTVHAYTASQKLVDAPDQGDFRRGRAAAVNTVPSTTGAAKAVTKVVTGLDNLFDGLAVRVPVASGSLVDVTFLAKRSTNVEEINKIMRAAAGQKRWQGIFTVTEEPLVSSDILGNTHASIADLAFTKVVGGDLVKILAWYDNEVGYANTLVRHVIITGQA
jgi:glyceraldehyde 3-phosphate dehydrogenase